MTERLVQLVKGFEEGVHSYPSEIVGEIPPDQAFDMGQRAAKAVIAPIVWAKAVGNRLDTTQATDLLGVSRQALAKRVAAGTVLGLPGKHTTYYPAWQFDHERGLIRPEVREVLGIFKEELDEIDPYKIAAWATTARKELDGMTPAQWLTEEKDPYLVFDLAREAAGRLAE